MWISRRGPLGKEGMALSVDLRHLGRWGAWKGVLAGHAGGVASR